MCVCLPLSACVSADPLNFAADQAEIENVHGARRQREKIESGTEIERDEDRGGNWNGMKRKARGERRKLCYLPNFPSAVSGSSTAGRRNRMIKGDAGSDGVCV